MATKKTTKAAKAPKAAPKGEVTVDPADQPLIPGSVVTFVAPAADGLIMARITTARGTDVVQASSTSAGARVSKVLETGHGTVSVIFSADGKDYASGSWDLDA